MGISEAIIGTILDKLNVEQKDIDKATEILDMISFTKENGKDVIVVRVGDNVEIKITK
tara:strand:+ start:1812 stop:1985 length:174 start_codon:yes stop_codon:yes gene_type:complete